MTAPLDLATVEAHLRTRREIGLLKWPSDDAYEEAREIALMDLAGDVPGLLARVRELEAALRAVRAEADRISALAAGALAADAGRRKAPR